MDKILSAARNGMSVHLRFLPSNLGMLIAGSILLGLQQPFMPDVDLTRVVHYPLVWYVQLEMTLHKAIQKFFNNLA